jgi:acyl-CoA thioester hydrolase
MNDSQANMLPPFVWPVRVYWEDTDAGGVVYYANYLKFMERARTEWLRKLGLEQTSLARDHGIAFVVQRLAVRYLRPARLDDRLEVTATIAECTRTRIRFEQQVRSDGSSCAEAEVTVACVDAASFRPARIPQLIVQHLEPST